jgi:hypothetical protein
MVSCSQQRFTFRKKVAVKNAEKIVSIGQFQTHNDTSVAIQANTQTSYSLPLSFIDEHDKMAFEPTVVILDDTIRKKYKFEENKRQNNSGLGSDPENGNSGYDVRADKDALVGFIFSLVSWFLFPFFAIPGLIYSIRGLKSFRRKGLAVAGIIISGIVLLLLVLLLILLFMLISRFGV